MLSLAIFQVAFAFQVDEPNPLATEEPTVVVCDDLDYQCLLDQQLSAEDQTAILTNPDIPETVIMIVSLIVVPVLVQVVKLYRKSKNPNPKFEKQFLTGLMVFLSIGFAIVFSPPKPSNLPVVFLDDPLGYMDKLFIAAAPFFAWLKITYDYIMVKVFTAVGWDKPKVATAPPAPPAA